MTFFWNVLLPNPRDPGTNVSPHYPFQRRAKLGPGPLGERNARAAKWDCTCPKPYYCLCDGIAEDTKGKRKKIKTDPKRKQKYNKMYRDWLKSQ